MIYNNIPNRNIKIIVTIVIVLAVLIGAYIVLNKSKENVSSKPIKLVAILPLTGSGADQAEWIKRGFEMALEEVNPKSKNKIEVIFEDSKGEAKIAIGIYSDDEEKYNSPVVFSWGSGVGIALTPLVNKDKVVQMGVATAASAYTTPDDFTFRNFPSANLEAGFLADAIINKINTRDIAVLN